MAKHFVNAFAPKIQYTGTIDLSSRVGERSCTYTPCLFTHLLRLYQIVQIQIQISVSPSFFRSGLHRTRFGVVPQARLCTTATAVVRWGRILCRLALVILLEAGHNAQIRLTLRTVVLGFAAQDPPVRVDRVPAEVASKGGPFAYHRTVAGAGIIQPRDVG